MQQEILRKRDFLDWLGVFVTIVRLFTYAAVVLGALYWFVLRPGGQAVVIAGIAFSVVVIAIAVACLVYVMLNQRRDP